jgi:hypothetical protein
LVQNTKTVKIYQITTHYTKCPYNITKVKWTKCPWNIPSSSNARPSKIYPNLDFGFENKPSGNPVCQYVCIPKISNHCCWQTRGNNSSKLGGRCYDY